MCKELLELSIDRNHALVPAATEWFLKQEVGFKDSEIGLISYCSGTMFLILRRKCERENIAGFAVVGPAGVVTRILLWVPKVVGEASRIQEAVLLIRSCSCA